MSAEREGGALSAEHQQALERVIKRQVLQRTWGRIQALEVQGVLDVTEAAGAMRIELNIQVVSPPESGREAPVDGESS